MGDDLSKEQIERLRAEAGAVGDTAMVEICDRALDWDHAARAELLRLLLEAEATMREEGQ